MFNTKGQISSTAVLCHSGGLEERAFLDVQGLPRPPALGQLEEGRAAQSLPGSASGVELSET